MQALKAASARATPKALAWSRTPTGDGVVAREPTKTSQRRSFFMGKAYELGGLDVNKDLTLGKTYLERSAATGH